METVQELQQKLPLGTLVRVRNGEPLPPARFHKKQRSWYFKNYNGKVEEHRADGVYIMDLDHSSSVAKFLHWVPPGASAGITVVQAQEKPA